MAIQAWTCLENHLSPRHRARRYRLLTLFLDPPVELSPGLNVNLQKHFGVLRSAELRALANVDPGFLWINPHSIGVIRYEIHLARKTRHPEAVIRICGNQRQESAAWMLRFAYRHVEFVRRYHVDPWVTKLPPELVTHNGDFDVIRILRGVLDAVNNAGRGKEQKKDNIKRNDCPCHFYLSASIDLRRFPIIKWFALPESNNGVNQETEYNDKYHCRDRKYKVGETENRARRRRCRREYAGRAGQRPEQQCERASLYDAHRPNISGVAVQPHHHKALL